MTVPFKPLAATTAALLLAGAISTPLLAGEPVHSLHVIKVGTGESDLIEADVTDLELGESRSFVTDSGKTVDILKAAEGIEIYIDGERIDIDGHADGHVEHHERKIAIQCDDTDGCDEMLADLMVEDDANVFVMRHDVEAVCDDSGECEKMVWIESDGEELEHIEELHEEALEDGAHKVIIIRKEVTTDSK